MPINTVLLLMFCTLFFTTAESNIYTQSLAQSTLKNNPFKLPESVLRKQKISKNVKNSSDESMQLRATLVSNEYPVANINGRVLTTGESINGYTLKKIFENKVILSRNGKDIELTMSK